MIATCKYLSAGRASAALDTVHGRVNEFPRELIFELIDAVTQELASKRSEPNSMVIYHLEQIFEALATRQDVPLIELARREYAVLPALGYRERTLSIHRFMAENPGFFVEILAHVFRSKSDETAERREATQQEIARAEVGYRLLSSFAVVPGTVGSEVDGSVLRSWINAVRGEATRIDRTEIADEHVGHVLAHSPRDPIDAGWPHHSIREVIELLNSDRIERGIQIERFNMRGVVSKAMFEGDSKREHWPRNVGSGQERRRHIPERLHYFVTWRRVGIDKRLPRMRGRDKTKCGSSRQLALHICTLRLGAPL